MSGTTSAPPVCVIDANGISVPTYQECLDWAQAQYQGIYGNDVYLGNDSQDGQWVAIFATAISDANSMCAAVYAAFSPATAQGVGLSTVVKINGLARETASYSTADVLIGGTANYVINNGVAGDVNGNSWSLPSTVAIGSGGSVTVTATCQTLGAVTAPANSITEINTPMIGWDSVTNPASATVGAPVEDDAELRARQALSTRNQAQTIIDAMLAAILQLPNVIRAKCFENDTNTTNGLGIPAHSLAFVVDGGDAQSIVNIIGGLKAPGAGTYGTSSGYYTDAYGRSNQINFSRPSVQTISVAVTYTALANYTSIIGAQIIDAIAAYISGLDIGANVLLTRIFVPANLNNGTGSETFEINTIAIAISPASPTASDITIAYNQAAYCAASNVSLTT